MKISSKIHRQEWKQEYLWEKKSENPFESEGFSFLYLLYTKFS